MLSRFYKNEIFRQRFLIFNINRLTDGFFSDQGNDNSVLTQIDFGKMIGTILPAQCYFFIGF